MDDQERLLGYDAREMWLDTGPLWMQQRRETYLLRLGVLKPLSTDHMVWPSVFKAPDDQLDDDRQLIGPDWKGPIQHLWDDLSALKAHLDRAWGRSRQPCWLIAVTLQYGLCMAEEQDSWDQRIIGIRPSTIAMDWTFLGYDVSDEWLLSGLMNCGYMPEHEDVEGLRRRWAPHLNEHHLFDDLEPAAAFKAVSDERVSEHAPFFVYGLYRLPHGESLAV